MLAAFQCLIKPQWLAAIVVAIAWTSATYGQELATAKTGTLGNGDFAIGPEYRLDPDLTDLGNPKGKSFEFTMRLADSQIFPGKDSTLDP